MKKLHNHSVGWLFIVFSLALNMFAFGWGGIHEARASSEASKPKSESMASDNKIYDDGDTAWTYNGNWSESAIRRAYGRKLHVSNTIGDSAAISISGTQFTLIFSRAPGYGQLDIYLDGVKIGTLNQKRSTTSYQKEWTSP